VPALVRCDMLDTFSMWLLYVSHGQCGLLTGNVLSCSKITECMYIQTQSRTGHPSWECETAAAVIDERAHCNTEVVSETDDTADHDKLLSRLYTVHGELDSKSLSLKCLPLQE